MISASPPNLSYTSKRSHLHLHQDPGKRGGGSGGAENSFCPSNGSLLKCPWIQKLMPRFTVDTCLSWVKEDAEDNFLHITCLYNL